MSKALTDLLARAEELTGDVVFLPNGEHSVSHVLRELHSIQIAILKALIAKDQTND